MKLSSETACRRTRRNPGSSGGGWGGLGRGTITTGERSCAVLLAALAKRAGSNFRAISYGPTFSALSLAPRSAPYGPTVLVSLSIFLSSSLSLVFESLPRFEVFFSFGFGGEFLDAVVLLYKRKWSRTYVWGQDGLGTAILWTVSTFLVNRILAHLFSFSFETLSLCLEEVWSMTA